VPACQKILELKDFDVSRYSKTTTQKVDAKFVTHLKVYDALSGAE
jgi:hypothetical protein